MARGFRPIVKTEKHEITFSRLAANDSSTQAIVLSQGVDVGAKTGATDCAIGSHIKWVFCEINFAAETITNPKVINWVVRVVPPLQTEDIPTTVNGAAKSYILKRGMEMLPSDQGTVYKRVFVVKIPKIYQRVKQAQNIEFQYVSSSTETGNTCGIFVYKEIY